MSRSLVTWRTVSSTALSISASVVKRPMPNLKEHGVSGQRGAKVGLPLCQQASHCQDGNMPTFRKRVPHGRISIATHHRWQQRQRLHLERLGCRSHLRLVCAMSSSTPSALRTYDGSRLALVQALPLLTARSCSARAWRQHCWQTINAELPSPGLSALLAWAPCLIAAQLLDDDSGLNPLGQHSTAPRQYSHLLHPLLCITMHGGWASQHNALLMRLLVAQTLGQLCVSMLAFHQPQCKPQRDRSGRTSLCASRVHDASTFEAHDWGTTFLSPACQDP